MSFNSTSASASPRIAKVSLSSIAVSPKTTWRHIVLTASDGTVGIGEYTLDGAVGSSGPPPGLDELALSMATRLLQSPVAEHSLSLLGPLPLESITHSTVYSACSQALVSLCAERVNVSVAEYLDVGPSKSVISLYANINRRTDVRTPDACALSAQVAIKAGFSAIKIAPFDGLTPSTCDTPSGQALIEAGLARIAAIREAVGPSIDIMIDCHWRFTETAILSLLGQLEALGVIWLECPIPETWDFISSIKHLRHATNVRGMRLCGLETSIGVEGYEPFLSTGTYDLVMPDIKHAGGYRAIWDIARQAQRHGVAISLHNPSGPIAHAASLQLSAVLPGTERLEIQFDESPLFWTMTDPPPPSIGDTTQVPTAPGLGVQLRIG
jgi:galactonate dehydratase